MTISTVSSDFAQVQQGLPPIVSIKQLIMKGIFSYPQFTRRRGIFRASAAMPMMGREGPGIGLAVPLRRRFA
jgi:hypothetical protein